jgi:hypothetical protein
MAPTATTHDDSNFTVVILYPDANTLEFQPMFTHIDYWADYGLHKKGKKV